MSFLRKKRESPRVDLTPMVDVVFLLLIFFMISTTFVETPGISVKLPESSSRQQPQDIKEVKVYLSKEGEIFLGKDPVEMSELRQRLRSHGKQTANMTFLLLADKEALHGKVVALMDLAKELGFAKLAIATEQRKRP